MSDQSSHYKEYRKALLKIMNIWKPHAEFHAELIGLKSDIHSFVEDTNSMIEQFKSLPKPGGSRSRTTDNADIVSLYNTTSNGVNHTKDNLNLRKGKLGLNSENMELLSKKVEVSEPVYAMVDPKKPWVRCSIVRVYRQFYSGISGEGKELVLFTLKSCQANKEPRTFRVGKYAVARVQDHSDKLTVGKRVIAGISKNKMLPGIIGQRPTVDNKFRYLVLMDNGSAIYFQPNQVLPILYQSQEPWEDQKYIEDEDIENIAHLKYFFSRYPRREFLYAEIGQTISLRKNGKQIVEATVIDIDSDVLRVLYKNQEEECVYRGSPRLLTGSGERNKQVALAKNLNQTKLHAELRGYLRMYWQAGAFSILEHVTTIRERSMFELTGQRNITKHQTARKSTSMKSNKTRVKIIDKSVEEDLENFSELTEEELYESKNHKCSMHCLDIANVKTENSVVDLTDEFRDVSDLKVPLLLGWKRKHVRLPHTNLRNPKFKMAIIYIAPCGKIFFKPYDISRYLMTTGSCLDVDYFTFEKDIRLNNTLKFDNYHYEENVAVEKRTKKPLENKFISLLNMEDEERLPLDFEYNNVVVPHSQLKMKGFTFNEEFKSSCDCEDDCFQRTTCACHRLNEEAAGKNSHHRGSIDRSCQYSHKRLINQVNTGVFECNSGCKCSSKCANRVVQNGIRFRLQISKMPGKKGWGVQTLDDIPAGAFICTYSAELLDDADQYGNSDMYYADLDYITVNEQNKEGLDDDDERLDEGFGDNDDYDDEDNRRSRFSKRKHESSDSSRSASSDSDATVCSSSSISSLSHVSDEKEKQTNDPPRNYQRYPKRKINQPQADAQVNNNQRGVFKRLHRLLNSRDYTLDARMQGNIGRFFNHSCSPNCYVQNVFIESHDLRFPVVAFFALKTIKATSEISWNYNYKTGSIEGRRIDCECGSANCLGRIL